MTIPAIIDRYEVIDRLGRGGMGIVYRARDPRLGRTVAIKVLTTEDEEIRRRFLQEARLVATLEHKNIVTVFDYGEQEVGPFIVMEYIEGSTLADSLARGLGFSIERKLALLRDLAAAIDYAHRRGIVHRDIKPANLMVDAAGRLKVLDFGVARAMESQLTQAGALIGTLNYMAPEQIEGRTADRRTDVFAVGVTAYEVLSGRKAFSGNAVVKAILLDDPVPLRDVSPDVEPDVEHIVNTAMAKDPSRRYATLAGMVADLDRALQRHLPASVSLRPDDEETRAIVAAAQSVPRPETRKHDALGRARGAFADGRYESAITAAAEVLETDPDNSDALDLTRLALSAFERRRTPAPAAAVSVPSPGDARARRGSPTISIALAAVAVLGAVVFGMRWGAVRSDRIQTPVAQPNVPARDPAPEPSDATPGPSPSPSSSSAARPRASIPLKAAAAAPIVPPHISPPAAADTPEALESACDRGEAARCFQLAQAYRAGIGVSQNQARAASLFQRACDAGDGAGCGSAGRVYDLGLGVPRDPVRAVSFYQRGCTAEDVVACEGLGWAYFRGVGIEQDEGRAVALFRRVCEQGNPAGCNNLGFAMEQGRGIAKDEKRAAELYQQACDKNNALGCLNLAWAHLRSTVIPHDSTRAAALFQRACEGGNANGCVNAGFAFVVGRGVGPDAIRAAALYQRACDAGTAGGCSRAAGLYEQGRGVAKDPARAAALNARARELEGGRDVRPDAGDTTAGTQPTPDINPPAPQPGATSVAGPVSPPARVKEVRPEYPAAALYARVQGEVVLEVTIGSDGAVTKTRVLRSIPLLDASAEDAVKQWRFAPTVVNGKPVAVTMPVTVRFTLNNRTPGTNTP